MGCFPEDGSSTSKKTASFIGKDLYKCFGGMCCVPDNLDSRVIQNTVHIISQKTVIILVTVIINLISWDISFVSEVFLIISGFSTK
jgi:hypothetical protein